jgi:hypothetical protein
MSWESFRDQSAHGSSSLTKWPDFRGEAVSDDLTHHQRTPSH